MGCFSKFYLEIKLLYYRNQRVDQWPLQWNTNRQLQITQFHRVEHFVNLFSNTTWSNCVMGYLLHSLLELCYTVFHFSLVALVPAISVALCDVFLVALICKFCLWNLKKLNTSYGELDILWENCLPETIHKFYNFKKKKKRFMSFLYLDYFTSIIFVAFNRLFSDLF